MSPFHGDNFTIAAFGIGKDWYMVGLVQTVGSFAFLCSSGGWPSVWDLL